MYIPLSRGCTIKQLSEMIRVCNFQEEWNQAFDEHPKSVLAKVTSLLALLNLTGQKQK